MNQQSKHYNVVQASLMCKIMESNNYDSLNYSSAGTFFCSNMQFILLVPNAT